MESNCSNFLHSRYTVINLPCVPHDNEQRNRTYLGIFHYKDIFSGVVLEIPTEDISC